MSELPFRLDKSTGKIYWTSTSKYHPDLLNKEAGTLGGRPKKPYWVICLNGKKLKRSHIVYFMTNGEWPKPCVDHINGNSLDDRPCNLRSASITQNAWNHKKRKRRINLPMGVRVNSSKTYSARIGVYGKQITIGCYQTPEEASAAYQIKRKELYGEFA